MKRHYTGDMIKIPYINGNNFLTGSLEGIFKDAAEREGVKINGKFYCLKRFEGVEIHATEYDLSVLVRYGATMRPKEGIGGSKL